MKNVIRGLLATSLIVSATFADVSNHTYMATRTAMSNNCAMGMVTPAMKGSKKDVGADVSVTGFYRQSHNNAKLATYFGGGQAADSNQNGKIEVAANGATTNALTGGDVDYNTDAAESMSGTAVLSPRRIEAGGHITWNQSLDKWVNGMSFRVDVPVTYVRTDMRVSYADAVANTAGTAAEGLGGGVDGFFAGSFSKTAPLAQAALANQTMGAKTNKTGVADVSVALAYDFVREKDYTVGACIHAGIPTGNKPAGVVAFEPTYGSRQFGLGAGLHGQFNLWRSEDGKNSLDLNLCGKYTYKFSAEEVRTLGLWDVANSRLVAAGHYAVVAKKDGALAPLANVSTLAVSVEPKSRIDGVAGFSYRMNRMSFDVMYNLFYAQEEKVTLKGAWNEDLYARPAAGLDDGADFSDLTGADLSGGAILKPANATGTYYVSPAAATTPAQVVHKVAGGLGYNFDLKTPIRLGAGAEVEVSSNNASVNSWAVFAKFGINF